MGRVASVAAGVVLFWVLEGSSAREAEYVYEGVCLGVVVNGRVIWDTEEAEFGRFDVHRLAEEVVIVGFVDQFAFLVG